MLMLLPVPDAFEICSVPSSTTVAPLYVFAPLRLSVPLPLLISPPVPLMVPETVVSLLLPPEVSVELPRLMLPAPEIEPTRSLEPNSKIAPCSTDKLVISFKEPATKRVPARIFVFPEYVLSPRRVNLPGPVFVNEPGY